MNSEIHSSEIPRALCTVLTNRTILSAVYMGSNQSPKKKQFLHLQRHNISSSSLLCAWRQTAAAQWKHTVAHIKHTSQIQGLHNITAQPLQWSNVGKSKCKAELWCFFCGKMPCHYHITKTTVHWMNVLMRSCLHTSDRTAGVHAWVIGMCLAGREGRGVPAFSQFDSHMTDFPSPASAFCLSAALWHI